MPALQHKHFFTNTTIMNDTLITGKVTFVNHEKKYIAIEYEKNDKLKSVNGYVDEPPQPGSKSQKPIKNKHTFHIGDTVNFTLSKSVRGDKTIATNIQYLYNNALDVLVNKAKTENRFLGYLKNVDGKYFVKEIDSYLFFPTFLSPWQVKPKEADLNEAVSFELENLHNKEKITASLFNQKFITEYYLAEKAFSKKEIIEAAIYKITPHGIYLNVFGENIQAKLPVNADNVAANVKIGDKLKIRISYLSKMKIAVEAVL
jgi:ribosomal protein S1